MRLFVVATLRPRTLENCQQALNTVTMALSVAAKPSSRRNTLLSVKLRRLKTMKTVQRHRSQSRAMTFPSWFRRQLDLMRALSIVSSLSVLS